jgi:hypothetical protein
MHTKKIEQRVYIKCLVKLQNIYTEIFSLLNGEYAENCIYLKQSYKMTSGDVSKHRRFVQNGVWLLREINLKGKT